VTLPLATNSDRVTEAAEAEAARPKAPSLVDSPTHSLTPSLPHSLRLDGVRVLVVDDEPDARELIERILAEAGAKVRAASAAAPAARALVEFSPHVLISDIGMPEEDGYTLIRRIRSLPADLGGQVPAAALTAFAGAEDHDRVLRAGFQEHVPKPVDADDLVAVVARLAGEARDEG
jgi:CheY-like chemotaxis protein